MPADLTTSFAQPDDSGPGVLEQPDVDTPQSILLTLCVYTSVSLLLLLLAPEGPLSIRLLVIALTLLTLKRWGGVLILLLVQADLFFRESQRQSALSGPLGIVFVVIVLLVLMFVASHQPLLQQISRRSVIRIVRDLLASSQQPESRPETIAPSKVVQRRLAAAIRGLALLMCCAAAARILLSLIPNNREFTENLRDLINADPSIAAGAVIIVAVVACWIVASEISWRQLSPAQARVYLRSIFLKAHYRDLRMIVVRRLKLRMKEIAAGKSRRKNEARTSPAADHV
jgi:hypothetical protein